MRSAIDLSHRDLRIFQAVHHQTSFSAAARLLQMSPSAVMRAIDRLETGFGERLLVRTTRRVYLTPAGERLAQRARQVLELGALVYSEVKGADAVTGTLSMTASASFGRAHLMPLIVHFLQEYPDVRCSVDFSDRVVDLLSSGHELAIRIGPLVPSDLKVRILCPEETLLCASPDYLAARGVPQTLADLQAHDCVLLGRERQWCFLTEGGAEVKVDLDGRLVTSLGDATREAAEAGLGIVRLSRWHAAEALQTGRLVPVLPHLKMASAGVIAALWPPMSPVPRRLSAFVAMLVEAFREPPWVTPVATDPGEGPPPALR